MINIKNLKADEIFLIFIVAGLLLLILGFSFYFLYIKPRKEKKSREEFEKKKAEKKHGEIDERIKRNQNYWKQVADYMKFIEKENEEK